MAVQEGGRFEPAWLPVFYNPVMTYNRDVSVLAVRTYIELLAPHRPIRGFDALSASGVRAVRLLLEVDKGFERMHANDIDYNAFRLIRSNAMLNNVSDRLVAWNLDANAALAIARTKLAEPLLYVDIDPFGSPVPFTREAVAATGHRGLLAITATDLAVLECRKPRPCLRKYLASCSKSPEAKELGLRILLGFTARIAAQTDKAIRPLLAYYADHYYRVYLQILRGARHADRMLEENIGYAYYCPSLKRTFLDVPPSGCGSQILVGPLWTGPLGDEGFISYLAGIVGSHGYLQTINRIKKEINLILEEYRVCGKCLHYRIDAIASAIKEKMPKRDELITALREKGYAAARTHFTPQGLRTNAPLETIIEEIRRLSSRKSTTEERQ